MKQKIAATERFFIDGKCMVQLALEADNNAMLKKMINFITKSVIGFKVCTDERYLYPSNTPITIETIPTGLESLRHVNDWAARDLNPDYSKTLARIATDEKRLVLNINHIVADGGFFVYLIDHINDEVPKLPMMPTPLTKLFHDEIESSKGDAVLAENDLNLNIARTTKSIFGNGPMTKYVNKRFPVNKLICFDENRRKCKGLTDSLWTSLSLSAMAFNGELANFGCNVCVNTRYKLKKVDFSICNNFAAFSLYENIRPDITIGFLKHRIRKQFTKKYNDNSCFNYLRSLEKNRQNINIGGCFIELTNLGPINLPAHVKDLDIGISVKKEMTDAALSLMSYGINSWKYNDVVMRLRYSDSTATYIEAKKILEGLVYSLTHIPDSTSIKDALSQIRKFQDSISK